jgi:hypothetical protein
MEIRFLKSMEANPMVAGNGNKGLSREAIAELESLAGQKFPGAFVEYLFLGGESANMLRGYNHSELTTKDYAMEIRKVCKASMAEHQVNTPHDFWIFAEYNECQFYFFYFDGNEDPPVYEYDDLKCSDDGKEYAAIEKLSNSFSEFIDGAIKEVRANGY